MIQAFLPDSASDTVFPALAEFLSPLTNLVVYFDPILFLIFAILRLLVELGGVLFPEMLYLTLVV